MNDNIEMIKQRIADEELTLEERDGWRQILENYNQEEDENV